MSLLMALRCRAEDLTNVPDVTSKSNMMRTSQDDPVDPKAT
jgi:hypothetical protein